MAVAHRTGFRAPSQVYNANDIALFNVVRRMTAIQEHGTIAIQGVSANPFHICSTFAVIKWLSTEQIPLQETLHVVEDHVGGTAG